MATKPNVLDQLFDLNRGSSEELDAYIDSVQNDWCVDDTLVTAHFYHLKIDPNGRPKVKPLADALANFALDYAIPRSEIDAADPALKNKSNAALMALRKQATSLFTDLVNSGEGGELLLYAFGEKILRLPQIVCKMALKTSSKMHFHGADGVHAGVNENGKLALYWGESKIHKSRSQAISECFTSLKNFLLADSFFDDKAGNDFQLIFRNPNVEVSQPELKKAIISYFDQTSSNAFDFEARALALVGFDCNKYDIDELSDDSIKPEIAKEIESYVTLIKSHCKNANLEKFSIYFFVLPFPSAEKFREEMLNSLGIGHDT